ncbi:hypothetical protein D9M72_330730 [compost metagenome]
MYTNSRSILVRYIDTYRRKICSSLQTAQMPKGDSVECGLPRHMRQTCAVRGR